MKKILSIVLASLLIVLPLSGISFAQNSGIPGATNTPGIPAATDKPETQKPGTASGFDLSIRLKNPLKVETIPEAIKLFMSALVRIAIPFIIIFFIWSGFNFILAQGNPDKIKKAKQMFLNTVIGALLILGAWTIVNAIVGTVNSLSS